MDGEGRTPVTHIESSAGYPLSPTIHVPVCFVRHVKQIAGSFRVPGSFYCSKMPCYKIRQQGIYAYCDKGTCTAVLFQLALGPIGQQYAGHTAVSNYCCKYFSTNAAVHDATTDWLYWTRRMYTIQDPGIGMKLKMPVTHGSR